jgi:hypothetical protein
VPDSLIPAACPVCHWPQPDVATCRQCGTVLRGDYTVGLPTPPDTQAYSAALAADQRRYDLRAAVLAAAPGYDDPALLDVMMSFCRGDADGASPESEAGPLIAGLSRTQAESAVGIGFPLARLSAGETAAIQFVEIGPDGIAVETLTGGSDGVPRRVPGQARRWPDLVTGLPADDANLRRFRLAGGVGAGWTGDPETLARSVRDAAGRAAATQLRTAAAGVGAETTRPWGVPAPSQDCVLVRRTSGWPLLEAAAGRVREVVRPIAEIVDLSGDALPQVVEAIARRTPLRHEYALALAARGQRGAVVLDPFPLFRAGTVVHKHDWPKAQLDVRGIFPGVRQLLLPVLARTGPDQAEWKEVGRAIVDARGGAAITVRFRLDGPGAVTLLGPAALAADDSAPRWPELLRDLPSRVPAGTATDVIVLVECGGDGDQARARLDLLDGVLDAAAHADLRVAVVGYRDHGVERSRPVLGSPLDTVEQARACSARLRAWEPDRGGRRGPGRFGDDNAAPLEDALDWAAHDPGWRPRARHLLLTIGRRPPHPPVVDDRAHRVAPLPCKNGIDWEATLVSLRKEHDVECFAVVPAAGGARDEYTDRVWQMIGTAGRIDSETASAERIVRVMELVPGADRPWCLAERADGRR